MDYYGLLFLYYLKGLSGKSVLRLFFNIEAGGTEQLLPENTSAPTTTPILADIQYPDGLRTDQYFTYRETPTTVSNKGRIKTIKGNTLVWNQVAPSMSSSVWAANRCTKTVSGNTFSLVGTNHTSLSFGVYIALANLKLTVNHDYLFMCVVNTNRGTQIRFTFDGDIRYTTITPNQDNVYSRVVSTATEDPVVCYIIHPSSITTSDTVTIKNLMIVDLTMLNDSRITDYDSFRNYYPLSYYPSNSGSLISFNGTGIKPTGKNLCNIVAIGNVSSLTGADTVSNARIRSDYLRVIANQSYTVSTSGRNTGIILYDMNKNFVSSLSGPTFTPTIDGFVRLVFRKEDSTDFSSLDEITCQLEFGSTATSYDPYTSSTLSLPISTYFPTGMKSAEDVYDELSPMKAITRIGVVDLGSLNWTYNANYGMYTGGLIDVIKKPSTAQTKANVLCANRTTATWSQVFNSGKESGLCGVADSGHFGYSTTETDPSTFKQSMSGVYLYYELATPTETPITTEDANEALSLLMGKSVSSDNAKQMIDIITKGE